MVIGEASEAKKNPQERKAELSLNRMGTLMMEDMEQKTADEDDDELSFAEFLDGLVAVAMYKDPNPFVPFKDRVELFLLDCVFRPLCEFWREEKVTVPLDEGMRLEFHTKVQEKVVEMDGYVNLVRSAASLNRKEKKGPDETGERKQSGDE